LVSTSVFERKLPPPPSVKRVISGSTHTEGLLHIKTNEVQSVYVSPEFRGTYALKVNGVTSRFLSYADGPAVVQAILNTLPVDSGKAGENFLVTTPEQNHLYIEFSGRNFSGLPQDLIEIVIGTPGVGDISFELDFNTLDL